MCGEYVGMGVKKELGEGDVIVYLVPGGPC